MRNGKLIISLLVIVIIVLLAGSFLNSISDQISKPEKNVNMRWTQLQSELLKRYVSIPTLTSTIRGYTKTEENFLTNLEDAYAKFQKGKLMSNKVKAANLTENAFGKIFAMPQFYPALKADRTFVTSLSKVYATEARVNAAKADYNRAAQEYNRVIKKFPAFLVSLLGFEPEKALFEGVTEVKKVPKIKIKTLG